MSTHSGVAFYFINDSQIKIIRSRSAYKASKVWLTDDIITVSLAQKFGSKKPKSQKYLGSKNK